MDYIAIAVFPKDSATVKELMSRRRAYEYPPQFKNVRSYLDARGGRAVIHFQTDHAEAILRYTADWPELTFDIFPVVPSERGWEIYLEARH
jgi:uroporphyrinogen-III decarboxylase